jgi:ribosomal protein L12E/L44/L45/RPP1/RPP2
VADVLADPAAFEGETLADPLEGVEYGRCKARIMRRADGTPWIHSFAHGRVVYEIKLDAEAVRAALEKTPVCDVVDALIRLVMVAELNDVEIEALIAWTATKTSSGIRAIARMLKQARAAAASEHKKQESEHRAASRTDPRPALPVPEADAPWLPEMNAYNAVLGKNRDRLPPARNIENQAACAQEKKLPGIHAFLTSNEG